jgi:hypothetical protein
VKLTINPQKLCLCGNPKPLGTYIQVSRYKDKIYKYQRTYSECCTCHNKKRAENPEKARKYGRDANKRKHEIIESKKNKPCSDCNKVYPYYVMDFDHKGNKLYNIAKDYTRISIEKLYKEIAKCDVVCSNCHRKRSYELQKRTMNGEIDY